jgi:glycosyltransferase involved in cell wall biosynthesis
MAEVLGEAVESIMIQSYQNWEVVIVNDGSTDEAVDKIGKELEKVDDRISYFQKENGGLGDARNYGVEKAKGEFVLLLDADNRLKDHFMEIAINAIEEDRQRAIIYGDAEYIGERNGIWKMGAFDKLKLLKDNYIDACALVNRKKLIDIGGFEVNLPIQGHEDWDLWLTALEKGLIFHYLNEVVFEYRVRADSMIRTIGKDNIKKNIAFIREKHYKLYCQNYKLLFEKYESIEGKLNSRIHRLVDSFMGAVFKRK